MQRSLSCRLLAPVLTALLSTTLLAGCAAGGGGVPDHGKYIDQITPLAAYPVAASTQALLSPANLQVSGVFDDPDATAYPRAILDRLLSGWKGPAPDIRIYVVPVEDFTSDVSANGAIFLNVGLLRYLHDTPAVQSEDVLAFVLAHELSHILLGHTVTDQQTQRAKDYTSSAMQWGSLFGQKIAGAGIGGSESAYASMALKAFADTTLFPSWTHGQEEQADVLGTDLLARAHYSTGAALTVLNILKAGEQRADAIAAAAAQNGPTSFTMDSFTYSAKKGDVLDQALVRGLNGLTVSHPHAAARIETVSRYILREYDDQDSVDLTRKPMVAWLRGSETTSLLRQSSALEQAALAVGKQDWNSARRATTALGEPAQSSAYLAYLTVRIAAATGRKDAATRLLSDAANRDDVTLPVALLWGQTLSQAGKTDDAETYLAAQQKAFNNRSFLAPRIENAKRAKNTALQGTLVVECMASGDTALEAQCTAANK